MTPHPTITEEALSEASRVFIATMQALDRRVSEEPIAPVQNSDAMNSAVLASHNPREALNRIGYLTTEAKEHLRNKDTTKAFVCLNKIAQVTGAL